MQLIAFYLTSNSFGGSDMASRIISKCSLRIACLSLLATTGGCVSVDIPDRKGGVVLNPNVNNSATTYDEAMAHLQLARSRLLTHTRTMEGFDATTRVVVMVGVAGAGIVASTEEKPARDVGKFLTGAAVGYMANRNVAPMAIAQVYRAGVTNLECIRAAALRAHGDVVGLQTDIAGTPTLESGVTDAIDALERDIAMIQSLPLTTDTTELQAPIQQTLEAIKSARLALRALRRFNGDARNDTLVGERVLAGVNGTMAIVNQQALARTPDVEAIFQSGAIFSRALTQGADWTSEIAAARTKLAGALSTTQSAVNTNATIRETLIRDQVALRVALSRIPDLSVDAGLAEISQCRTMVAVLQPVSVSPSPIALTAGGDAVPVKLGGRAPHVAQDLPSKVSYDPYATSLKASDGAVAGSYTIHFIDANGVASPDTPLTVAAKPAAAPAAAPAAPAQPGEAPQAAPGGAGKDPPAAPAPGGPPATPKLEDKPKNPG